MNTAYLSDSTGANCFIGVAPAKTQKCTTRTVAASEESVLPTDAHCGLRHAVAVMLRRTFQELTSTAKMPSLSLFFYYVFLLLLCLSWGTVFLIYVVAYTRPGVFPVELLATWPRVWCAAGDWPPHSTPASTIKTAHRAASLYFYFSNWLLMPSPKLFSFRGGWIT